MAIACRKDNLCCFGVRWRPAKQFTVPLSKKICQVHVLEFFTPMFMSGSVAAKTFRTTPEASIFAPWTFSPAPNSTAEFTTYDNNLFLRRTFRKNDSLITMCQATQLFEVCVKGIPGRPCQPPVSPPKPPGRSLQPSPSPPVVENVEKSFCRQLYLTQFTCIIGLPSNKFQIRTKT